MKIYRYEERTIIEFDDKTRASYNKKKFGDIYELLLEQSINEGRRLFNPYFECEDYFKILTSLNGKTYEILVDKDDFPKLKEMSWRINHNGYAISGSGCYGTDRSCRYLHQEVMNFKSTSKMVIDHINNNPLDNRKSNLRIVSTRDNNTNLRNQENKGVNRTSCGKGWRARWSINGKHYSKQFFGEDSYEKAREHRRKMMKEAGYLRMCND